MARKSHFRDPEQVSGTEIRLSQRIFISRLRTIPLDGIMSGKGSRIAEEQLGTVYLSHLGGIYLVKSEPIRSLFFDREVRHNGIVLRKENRGYCGDCKADQQNYSMTAET